MKWIHYVELDQVAYVKLDRPDVRNAFNPEMIQELTQIFTTINQHKHLRAACLSGEGKAFCAGADLNWMKQMVDYTLEENRQDALVLFGLFESIARCEIPVIGLVHGAAFGGALGLIACCDHVIAEKGTQFCFSEVKLGIAPAVISSFVNRKCAPGLVRPYMLSAQIFGVSEALRVGLVHEEVEAGEGHHHLQKVVHQYQQCGPEALRETKKLLNEITLLDWPAQKAKTTQVIAQRRISAEGQEGLKSFLEKRDPHWRNNVKN